MPKLELENPSDLLERACAGVPLPPDAPEGIVRDALVALMGLCRDIDSLEFIEESGHNAKWLGSYREAVEALEVLRLWPPPPYLGPDESILEDDED